MALRPRGYVAFEGWRECRCFQLAMGFGTTAQDSVSAVIRIQLDEGGNVIITCVEVHSLVSVQRCREELGPVRQGRCPEGRCGESPWHCRA